MAIPFEHHPARSTGSARHAAGLVPFLRVLPGRIACAWRRHRAARDMESLSYDMRKDFGFRSADTCRR